jgi:hypothetical protein
MAGGESKVTAGDSGPAAATTRKTICQRRQHYCESLRFRDARHVFAATSKSTNEKKNNASPQIDANQTCSPKTALDQQADLKTQSSSQFHHDQNFL